MTSGVARALIAAMKNQTEPRPLPSDSVFGNPQRRRVFQSLCVHPCGSLLDAAKALGLSPATVRFHIARLQAAGFVAASEHGFYPRGLLDPDDIPLFESLSTAAVRRVLATAHRRPGMALIELARETGMTRQATADFLKTFESIGLVTRVNDGKFVRVYPTTTLQERRERHRVRAQHYAREIVRRLAMDGKEAQVLRRTVEACLIRVLQGSSTVVLEIRLEPYAYVLL